VSSSATPPTQIHIADIALNSEIISVINVSGTTWTVIRGDEGTTPVAHGAGLTVYQVVSAGGYTQLRAVDWLNVVTQFGADNTGATDTTTAINNAVDALPAAGGGVYFPAGTYKITSALNWKVPGLTVITDGAAVTKIVQNTANTPIIQVAGQGQSIGGLTLAYTTQQTTAQTAANGIEFGDATIGSCFMSTFCDLYVQKAYTGLAIPSSLSSSSAAGLFSCHLRNIHVNGYAHHGIGLNGNGGGGHNNCTGCVFENVYIHNNATGSPAPCDSTPLFLAAWDEVEFYQLNIEHGESFISDLIGCSQVGTCKIDGLHIESMQLSGSGGNAAYINADDHSAVLVDGMTIRFSTMSGTTDNPVARFSTSGPSSVIIRGYKESGNTLTTPAHPWADFGSVDGCTVTVEGITASQVTGTSINPGAGCLVQASAAVYGGIFGDGSDGTATLDGAATVAWASKSGSTYTMTADAFLTSLTINSGVTLKPAGFRIFCTGTVANAGTVSADGNAGQAGGTAGGSTGSAGLTGGRPGGAGNTGAGSAGTAGSVGVSAAGAGGSGSSGSGGAGGSVTATSTRFFRTPYAVLAGVVNDGSVLSVTGAPGGGGGAGDGANKGGGGGSGGGPIAILAYSVVNTGTLTSAGGAGGTPAAGNCGGGGGGSGGPILIYTLSAWTAGTTAVTAGAAGSGVGTGASGTAGAAGNVLNVIIQ
jgi:hypothetical protein